MNKNVPYQILLALGILNLGLALYIFIFNKNIIDILIGILNLIAGFACTHDAIYEKSWITKLIKLKQGEQTCHK